jgi:hypothetical protein
MLCWSVQRCLWRRNTVAKCLILRLDVEYDERMQADRIASHEVRTARFRVAVDLLS